MPPPLVPDTSGSLLPASPPPLGTPAGSYYPNQDERLNGMLPHLLGLLTGFLGPLILWLVNRNRSAFLDHQGKEALNFQITILIVVTTGVLLGTPLAILTLGFALLVLIPLYVVYLVLVLIYQITGIVRSNRGEWYTYPMSLRLIA